MSAITRALLRSRYLGVPGLTTVTLTRNPLATAPVSYVVRGVRARQAKRGAMAGSPYATEPYDRVFNLPEATLPAGIVPIGGDKITDKDGLAWLVQSVDVRLDETYYKCGCTSIPRDNDYVPEPPPDSGGEPEEPAGPVPTAAITAVAPDPRATAISSLEIVFNKPVTGFSISNLTLTRNGGANLLSGSQTLTTSDNQTWTLGNLSSLTGTNGTYLLTVVAGPGIVDQAGQALAVDATESWVMNSALFTAAITAVSPDPRNTAVSSITIVFSAAVGSGFTLADLTLKRNGGSNLLTGSQTLTTGNNITWTLGNLSGITASSGTYLLTLTASGSGIVDGSANALSGDATETWTTDATVPTATVTPVTADPRTLPVESVQVVFSEAVTGVSAGAFSLSLNGGANLLTGGQSVTTSDNITWTLHGLTAVSGAVGTYLLTLNALGSGIADLAGNALAANATDSWVVVAPALVALPTSDDRMEAGQYQTSLFVDKSGGPWPHKMGGIILSYDQANILTTEVLTGLPDGPTRLNQNLNKFIAGAPQSLCFFEVTGSGLVTEQIMNAYRLPGGAAGRWGGRGVYPPHALIYNAATMASRVRSDYGVRPFGTGPGQSIVSTAYMDLSTPSNRAFWAEQMSAHLLSVFAQFPQYQGVWMDEMADKLLDPNHGPLIEVYNEYIGVIRDAIRAGGRLISTNLSTHFQFTEAAADAIVDNCDLLMVEKMYAKGQMTIAQFATTISRMRRMWARNPGGFGIFDYQGIDFDDSIRLCTVTAATNGPSGGMRFTCSSPHYLDLTADKSVGFANLSPFDPGVFYQATKVTDTVFDLLTAPPAGTLSPTGSSTARFIQSDTEIGAALGMIARQQPGRPYYLHWTPLPQYDSYRWPTLYGQPTGDYEITATSGSLITRLRCNFAGGTLGPHRVTVEPQGPRRAYWEPI